MTCVMIKYPKFIWAYKHSAKKLYLYFSLLKNKTVGEYVCKKYVVNSKSVELANGPRLY